MTDDGVTIKGLSELTAELKDLAPNIEKEALRMGLFRAAQMMRDAVREQAPISSGDPPKGKSFAKFPPGSLKKSIKAKRRRGTKTEAAAGITGAFYAKMVEFGHVLRGHKPNKEELGHVAPNPFIMRAFEANQERVVEHVRQGVLEAIQKKVEKLRAKMPRP